MTAMTAMACAAAKADLRARLRSARQARPVADRSEAAAALERRLLALVGGLATVAGFVPAGDEPGHGSLLDLLCARGTTVLLPVLRDDLDLDWAAYRPGGLAPGRVRPRLAEPDGPLLGVAAVAGAELVLVPALAVAHDGTRLGFGGGSYDRALARVRAPSAAVVYDEEVLAALPRQPHDRPVSMAVTPARLLALPHA